MKRVDLRSDTVTTPTEGMRDAMRDAVVGDDVFGDDPTVNQLQEVIASMLGKESALFVPTGTMANQLALRAHTRSGDEYIAHSGCHIVNYESGAVASLAGLLVRVIESDDGSLPLEAVKARTHQTEDPHFAPTTLISFENTHNGCGGVVVPQQNILDVTQFARERGIGTHLDGARLFNAAAASETTVAKLAEPFDTISVCLSKGLGAPVGSVLAGSKALITKAYRYRKMYGGGMRQVGVLAAAGLYALENHTQGLVADHSRAQNFGESLNQMPGLAVDLERAQTNLIYFALEPEHKMAEEQADGSSLLVHELAARGVLVTGGVHGHRAAFHHQVTDDGLQYAIECFSELMRC